MSNRNRKITVKSVETEEQPGLVYTPRKLSILELEYKFIVVEEIGAFLNSQYKFDEEKHQYILTTRQDKIRFNALAWTLLGRNDDGKGLTILFADATGELPVAEVIRWAEEYPTFFEECYKKAIDLNPSLAPANVGLTAAQPETKGDDGKPISREEAEKNA